MATNNKNSCSQQQNETLQYFDKIRIDLPWNQKDKNKSIDKIEPMEVGNLSQKLSQLSTNTIEKNELLLKDIKAEIEKIPAYLTKRNKSFLEIMKQALSKTAITTNTQPLSTTKLGDTTDSIDKLRKIAILIYKIMVIQTYQVLWAAYFKSGMGQLVIPAKTQVSYSINVPIWPKELKAMLLSKNMDKTHENDTLLKFVNKHLDELDYQLKQYQNELNIKANNFQGYSLTIQKIIELYIEQNLHSLRMEIEYKVKLIHYDYHIQALKLEYFRHKPNEYQKELMKQVCQSNYEKETSEQEYHFLKQQIAYYNLPNQSFECSPIAHCPLINSIQNATIRQELFKQYKEVAEQLRAALFDVYLQSAEDQREEYKKKYEIDEQKMNSSKDSLDEKERISSIMIHLINQRCNKISERIKCIYNFRSQSILMKS
ncbi:unnamed protein product [Rotaria sordida]|uniref:Uncharacterized protein n=1 Tax=Rotaria sordida TaxID=392033 RepID=A0A815Y339_9BILA|nr:unnamed protein product [Rotaria sordida]CAF1566074.1 unnamed protein product [Rotaria sordida]